jgi:hypothetical protein
MRKFFIILTLAVATLTATGAASAYDPPDCYPNCQLAR